MAVRSVWPAEVPRRITVDEFEAMHRAGRWQEDDRVELINGEIRLMSPINDPHIGCVDRLNWLFSRRFGDDVIIHVQNPVRLDPYNEPQPAVTVLRFRADFYSTRKAAADDIRLLVEVADSSLGDDLTEKREIYARTGIPEYWVVDLNHELVHVHHQPDAATGQYQHRSAVSRGRELTARFAPGIVFSVDEILG
jgi:Uma2 family endonuclease